MSTDTLTRAYSDPRTASATVAAGQVDPDVAAYLVYCVQLAAGVREVGADLKAICTELAEQSADRAVARQMLARVYAAGDAGGATEPQAKAGVRGWLREIRAARKQHKSRRDDLAMRIADLVCALPHAA